MRMPGALCLQIMSFLCHGALPLTAVGMGSADACVHRGAQRCFLGSEGNVSENGAIFREKQTPRGLGAVAAPRCPQQAGICGVVVQHRFPAACQGSAVLLVLLAQLPTLYPCAAPCSQHPCPPGWFEPLCTPNQAQHSQGGRGPMGLCPPWPPEAGILSSSSFSPRCWCLLGAKDLHSPFLTAFKQEWGSRGEAPVLQTQHLAFLFVFPEAQRYKTGLI